MDDAVEILFCSHDRGLDRDVEHGYERSLSVEDALREEVFLVYEMSGVPLPPQHGSPLHLVVPDWYGMASVKWLRQIRALENLSRASSKCSPTTTKSLKRTRART